MELAKYNYYVSFFLLQEIAAATSKIMRYKFGVFKTTQTAKSIHGVSSECVGTLLKMGCSRNTFRGAQSNVLVWHPRSVAMGCWKYTMWVLNNFPLQAATYFVRAWVWGGGSTAISAQVAKGTWLAHQYQPFPSRG